MASYKGNPVRWWVPSDVADKEETEEINRARASALLDETAAIEMRQSSYHELVLWNATLYFNRELPGFRWGMVEEAESELWPVNLRTENLVSEIGESMLSKASSSPLKPTPVPHGTSYKVEQAVRELDEFILGVWRACEAEDACVQMFRDAYIAGYGCVHISYDRRKKTIAVRPVFFDNVIIDNRECANRRDPKVYRIREVLPKSEIEARFGVELGVQGKYHHGRECAEGWAVLVTAWRMPDPNGKGGRETIACCGQILSDREYDQDTPPLVFFHWQDRASGFTVPSGVEEVVPYQLRQNELNDDIKDSQDIACRPRLMVQANSQINIEQWDNAAGRFLAWSGSAPEPLIWPTNLGELYNERERNRQTAFSHMGISEMFANADLPQGMRVDSSAAVREVRNMEDGRHLRRWTNFEKARMRVAKTILMVLRGAKGADAFTSVYHPGGAKASAKSIPWEAVKTLTDDKYSWSLEPTPIAMLAPAARRELLRDWTSRGLIETGSDEARRMEGNPNLERIEDLEMASADDILRHLGILEKGEYEAPSELTNCTLGIKRVTANYHRLKKYTDEKGESDVPSEIFENHIKWVVAAVAIQQAAIAPPPQDPAADMSAFAPTQGMPGTNASQAPRTIVNNNG